MKSVSIRDIEKGIVTSQSPFNQQIGSFSHFFSEDRKRNWHRINMENLLMQNNLNQTEVQNILMQGFKAILISDYNKNIKLSSIDSGIKSMSNELLLQKKILENSNSVLNEILESIKNPRAIEAKEKANQAAVNIKDALSLEKSRAERLLEESIFLLQESIKINDYDYKAHFDIGWLYSFFKNDLEKAEFHYDTCVLRSISRDSQFTAFALRHLADTRYHSGNLEGAIKAIDEAEKLEDQKNLETSFEYVRYLTEIDKDKIACEKIERIITQNPIYYALTEKEIDLDKHLLIRNSLDKLLAEKKNHFAKIIQKNIKSLKSKYHDALKFGVLDNHIDKSKKKLENQINSADYFQLVSWSANDFVIEDNNWKTERDRAEEKKEKEERRKEKNKETLFLTIRIIFSPIVIPLFIVLGYLTSFFGLFFNKKFHAWAIFFFIVIPIQFIIAIFLMLSKIGLLFEDYFVYGSFSDYFEEIWDKSKNL